VYFRLYIVYLLQSLLLAYQFSHEFLKLNQIIKKCLLHGYPNHTPSIGMELEIIIILRYILITKGPFFEQKYQFRDAGIV